MTEKKPYLPSAPYPGIDPFSYSKRNVFFAREKEARALVRLVVMYRGVLLYADSGLGKSSLINAGLIPMAMQEGYQAERIRVQPKAGQEIIIERISEFGVVKTPFLPSIFASDDDPEPRIVLAVEEFLDLVHRKAEQYQPLLIFDQFEEWVTLFEGDSADQNPQDAKECQAKILEMLTGLIRDDNLPVKVLIALREDYLAKLNPLFKRFPDLPDQYLRITPLDGDQVKRAIRGPFVEHPGRYPSELGSKLAKKILAQFEQRAAGEEIRLTEVQIVCRRLWDEYALQVSEITEEEFRLQEEVKGIIEGFLKSEVENLESDLRYRVMQVLGTLITEAGTRDIVSEPSLRKLLGGIELSEALGFLEIRRLVHKTNRRGTNFYELSNEWLIPPIQKEKLQLEHEKELEEAERLAREEAEAKSAQKLAQEAEARRQIEKQRREEAETYAKAQEMAASQLRKRANYLIFAVVIALILAFLASLGFRNARIESNEKSIAQADAEFAAQFALTKAAEAENAQKIAETATSDEEKARVEAELALKKVKAAYNIIRSNQLAAVAIENLETDPQLSLLLSIEAVRLARTIESENALRQTIQFTRREDFILSQGEGVNSLLFDSSDKRLISAGDGSNLRLWQLASIGKSFQEFGADHWIDDASISPDGERILAVIDNEALMVWTIDGDFQFAIEEGDDWIVSAEFSPDGSLIYAHYENGTVLLWDRDGNEIASPALFGVLDDCYAISFDPLGAKIALVDASGKAFIKDLEGETLATLEGQADFVYKIEFSLDGNRLLTTADDGTAFLYDSSGNELASINSPEFSIEDASFSPDGAIVLTTSDDGIIRLWDDQGQLIAVIEEPEFYLHTAKFSPDGKWVASVSDQGIVHLWDLGGKWITTLRSDSFTLYPPIFSPDGTLVAVIDNDQTVRLWDIATLNKTGQAFLVAILQDDSENFTSASFHPVDSRILTKSESGTARLWAGIEDGEYGILHGSSDQIVGIALNESEQSLSAVGYDGSILEWDLMDLTDTERKIPDFNEKIIAAFFSNDHELLAFVDDEGYYRVWGMEEAKTPQRMDQYIWSYAAAFNPDGNLLAYAVEYYFIELRDVSDLSLIFRSRWAHEGDIRDLAFSPDGLWLASTGDDGTVRLWNMNDLDTDPIILRGHVRGVTTLAFSQDGKWLASGSEDGNLRLWDVQQATQGNVEGAERGTLRGHQTPISSIVFDDVGKYVIAGGADGTLRRWEVNFEDIEQIACNYVSRNFTYSEWETYFVDDEEYRQTCSTVPPDISVVDELINQRMLDDALAVLQILDEHDPSLEIIPQAQLAYMLGEAYLQDDLVDQALPSLREAVELDPSLSKEVSGLILGIGREMLVVGDFDKALVILQVALDFNPDLDINPRAEVAFSKGSQYLQEGLIDEALALFEEAATEDDSLREEAGILLGEFGYERVLEGKFDEALVIFRVAMEYNPTLGMDTEIEISPERLVAQMMVYHARDLVGYGEIIQAWDILQQVLSYDPGLEINLEMAMVYSLLSADLGIDSLPDELPKEIGMILEALNAIRADQIDFAFERLEKVAELVPSMDLVPEKVVVNELVRRGVYFANLEDVSQANANFRAVDQYGYLRQINFGDSVSGVIELGGYQAWQFEGEAGQIVSIFMERDKSFLDPYLIIVPQGVGTLAEDDDSGGDLNAMISFYTLEETGPYIIVARGYDELSYGAYTLTLEEVSSP